DEKGSLADREPFRLLAEVSEARGPKALDIAAIGRQQEVEIENLRLRARTIDLDRADHLAKLRRDRAIRARLEETRHLHGERRGARDDAAFREHLPAGA